MFWKGKMMRGQGQDEVEVEDEGCALMDTGMAEFQRYVTIRDGHHDRRHTPEHEES